MWNKNNRVKLNRPKKWAENLGSVMSERRVGEVKFPNGRHMNENYPALRYNTIKPHDMFKSSMSGCAF